METYVKSGWKNVVYTFGVFRFGSALGTYYFWISVCSDVVAELLGWKLKHFVIFMSKLNT